MTPAVKTALAYAFITGWLPSGIHITTWGKANKHITRHPYPKKIELSPEALDAIKDHPMIKAHNWLRAQGFLIVLDTRRTTSHYVKYDHEDGRTASAYRSGDASIRTAIYTEAGVFMRNQTDVYREKDLK